MGLGDGMTLSYLGKSLFCLNSVKSYSQVSIIVKKLNQASDIRSVTIHGPLVLLPQTLRHDPFAENITSTCSQPADLLFRKMPP